MSDVSALLLSIGEDYATRAAASVERQRPPVAETIVVRGVSPFYRAMNAGVAQVRTEFFIQVDADMILDDSCVADLKRCMTDRVGVVVGHLRDPLLGRVVGIKLFRTCCFELQQYRDSLSPDTDFVADILGRGWSPIYALKAPPQSSDALHTFGEHRPDYTPQYTFSKFTIEGARARYRRSRGGARNLLRRLHLSQHGAATIALVAAAHGIFLPERCDLLQPYTTSAEGEFLQRFLDAARAGPHPCMHAASRGPGGVVEHPWIDGMRQVAKRVLMSSRIGTRPAVQRRMREAYLRRTFRRWYRLGIELRRAQASDTFLSHLAQLGREDRLDTWAATVGLCHGLFVEEYDDAQADAAFVLLMQLQSS